MSITTQVRAGDHIVFIGYRFDAGLIIDSPRIGARARVRHVHGQSVVTVTWDEPMSPLVSNVLLGGEYEVTLHAAPVIAPKPTLRSRVLGWVNPDRLVGAMIWFVLGIGAGIAVSDWL